MSKKQAAARRLLTQHSPTMVKSISETLAKIREEVRKPKAREIKYNAQGIEIRKVESWGGTRERIYTPSNLQERERARISHEDNFDPS